MKFKKVLLFSITILAMSFILTGCGARINTELNITKDFSGQRKIDVAIDNEYLGDYLNGDIGTLETIASSKLPEDITYTFAPTENGYLLTFSIDFENIEDYRNKVSAIVSAGSNAELTPEVAYENMDTVFKKGVRLNENFTSFDLLQWYYDAVKESGVVNYSDSSEWYEFGDSKVFIDDKEYSSREKLSLSDQELSCIDRLDVKTTLNLDGSFTREFKFLATDSTVEILSGKGCDLSTYISELATEDDTYKEISDNSVNQYIITVEAPDAEELTKRTDEILNTQNSFSLNVELNEEVPGNANVNLEEKLDGSYYLDYSYKSPLISTIVLYVNSTLTGSDRQVSIDDDVLVYSPSQAADNLFAFDWKISFGTVEIVPDIKSLENSKVDIVFTPEESMRDDLKESAVEALKSGCDESVELKEQGDAITASFSGTVEEVEEQINTFVRPYDRERTEGKRYFIMDFSPSETPSRFTTGFMGSIAFDLTPVTGNTEILFSDKNGLLSDCYYQGSFVTDKDGNRKVNPYGQVSFTLVKVSFGTVVIFAISCIALICGVVILFINRKEIVNVISDSKNAVISSKKQKAATEEKAVNQSESNADTRADEKESAEIPENTRESSEEELEEDLLI